MTHLESFKSKLQESAALDTSRGRIFPVTALLHHVLFRLLTIPQGEDLKSRKPVNKKESLLDLFLS